MACSSPLSSGCIFCRMYSQSLIHLTDAVSLFPSKKSISIFPFLNKGRGLRFAIDHRGKAKCTIFKVTALPLRLIAGSQQDKGKDQKNISYHHGCKVRICGIISEGAIA